MPVANLTTSMGSSPRPFSGDLGAAEINSSAAKSALAPSFEEGWNEAFNQLIDWWRVAGEVDEDGLQSPTQESISAASKIICGLRAKRMPAPARVVMGGDGGIAVEFSSGEFTARIEIEGSGTAEFILFEKHRIRVRQPLGN